MKNSRLYMFIIAMLVFLNLSCLYFLWKSGTIGNGRDPKFRIENYLTQELKFDHAQQDKFAELRTDHREKVKTIKDKNRKFHENYFDQLKSISIDSQALQLALDSITSLQRQIEVVTFDHFYQLRAICTDSQKIKYDEIIQDALRMFAPGGPPRDRK